MSEELDKAFKSAESIDEILETFKQIAASASNFKQSQLVFYCWAITDQLLKLPHHNPQQVFSFGKSALQIYVRNIPCFLFPSNISIDDEKTLLRRNHGSSFFVACVCYLLGTACYGLKRYDECLGFLDWADCNLSKLEEDDSNNNSRCERNCVRHVLVATQLQFYKVKVTMGMRDEALVHKRKVLEFKELVMDGDSIELGNAYIEAYEAYVGVMDVEQALPLCLKALEICIKRCGQDSREVALLRVDLAVMYLVVGEYEKASEQNQLWQSVLKNTDSSSDFLNAELKVGIMLIHLGRSEKAIEVCKGVVSRKDTKEDGRVASFVTMASASCSLRNFDDVKEYMRAAERILEENDIDDPIFVGNVFVDMSGLYEKMDDFVTAISLLKRVFEKAEHHQKILAESMEKLDHLKVLAKSSTMLFSLISLAGREKQEIQYMMDVVEKLEKCFGREHIEVGYGCAKLGAALINSGLEDPAVKFIENAKDILYVALGPHHVDSLRTNHALSEIYAKFGRYENALEIQKKVVEDSKGLEPSEQQFMDKAVTLLNEMKERVAESPTRVSTQSQDVKDLSAEKSECGTSGDEIRPE